MNVLDPNGPIRLINDFVATELLETDVSCALLIVKTAKGGRAIYATDREQLIGDLISEDHSALLAIGNELRFHHSIEDASGYAEWDDLLDYG